MNCKYCHREIPDNSIVCPKCGSFVAESVSGNMAAVAVNRAFMYLEDGEFDKAKQCFMAVMAGEPENASAYLGMLMAELEVCKEDELVYCASDFSRNKNYQKAIELGGAQMADKLGGYLLNRDPSKKPEPPKPPERKNLTAQEKPSEPVPPVEIPQTVQYIEIPSPVPQPQFQPIPTPKPDEPAESKQPVSEDEPTASEEKAEIPKAAVWTMVGIFAAIVIAVVVFVVCRSEVYLSSSNTELGSVEGGGGYWIWESPQITAVPAEGCEFISWTDGNTDNPRTVDVKVADSDYMANFAKKKYNVTVNLRDEGGSVMGGGIYQHGEIAEIEAVPATGYDFIGWEDGSTAAKRNIFVNKNLEYKAIFKKKVFLVSSAVNSNAMGRVTGVGNYEYGSTATLTAEPNVGYKFVSWSDGTVSPTKSFTVTKDISYNATFQTLNYTISTKTNRSDLGSVTGGGTYAYGSTVTLKAVSSSDAYFVSWSDGITNATRKVSVTGNKTYTANFALMNPVASVGGVEYGSIQAAVNAAKSGDTVTLLKDTVITSKITVSGKNLTIDGNRKKITANFTGEAIRMTGGSSSAYRLNIKDLKLINNSPSGICIETYGTYVDLDLDGCELTHKGGNDGLYSQVIRLSGRENGLYISDCQLLSDDGAIAVDGNAVIEITSDSRIRANEAFMFLYDASDSSSVTAKRSKFEIYGSGAVGSIFKYYGGASDISVELTNCEFDIGVAAGNLSVRLVSAVTSNNVSPARNSVKITGDNTVLNLISGGSVRVGTNSQCQIEILAGTYNNSAFASYVRSGYTVTDNKNGTWTVK